MDGLNGSPMEPWQVSAVVVGLETYDASGLEVLPGAARNALQFAQWLTSVGVLARNIRVLLRSEKDSSAENGQLAEELGLRVEPAHSTTIRSAFGDLRGSQNELLIVHWGGHGTVQHGRRYLFYPDATDTDRLCVDFDELRSYVQGEDFASLTRQLYLVDACGSYTLRQDLPLNPIGFSMQDPAIEEILQSCLFASRKGQSALNDPVLKTGEFSDVVLRALRAGPPTLPPDIDRLAKAASEYFNHPDRIAFNLQNPVLIHSLNWDGWEEPLLRPPTRRPVRRRVLPDHLAEDLGRLGEESSKYIRRFGQSQVGQAGGADRKEINVRYRTLSGEGVPQSAAHRTIRKFYAGVPGGRLVLTGPSGSGKTALAVKLTRDLLEQRATTDCVPVFFRLSNWIPLPESVPRDGTRSFQAKLVSHFERWMAHRMLVEQLIERPKTAEALVTGRWILPVLDGLDEVGAGRDESSDSDRDRGALLYDDILVSELVLALNGYLSGGDQDGVVVTVRTPVDDVPLPLLPEACVVEMQRLSKQEIEDALARRHPEYARSPQWTPVREDLRQGEERASIAERRLDTPWKLVLASLAIKDSGSGITPADLVWDEPNFDSVLHDRLLAAFVPSAYKESVVDRQPPPNADSAVLWLTELAQYSNAVKGTWLGRTLLSDSLELKNIWPIAGDQKVRRIQTMVHVLVLLLLDSALLLAAAGGVGHGVQTISSMVRGTLPITGVVLHRVVAAGAFSVAVMVAGVWLGHSYWSWVPERVRRTRGMRERKGWTRVVSGLEIGGAIGAAVGLCALLLFGWVIGVVAAAVVGVSLGAGMELKVGLDRTLTGSWPPFSYWRIELLSTAACALVGLLLCPTLGWATTTGLAFGAVIGFCGSFAISLIGWLRYVIAMTIMILDRRLPWRLAAFLDWADGVGVLRISGTSWQFRHSELRLWLASQAGTDRHGNGIQSHPAVGS